MKAFLRRYRAQLRWLAGLAAFFAVYFPLRTCRGAMNWLCSRVILPLEQALGRLCSVTSVSVAEVLIYPASLPPCSIWRGRCGVWCRALKRDGGLCAWL